MNIQIRYLRKLTHYGAVPSILVEGLHVMGGVGLGRGAFTQDSAIPRPTVTADDSQHERHHPTGTPA